MLLHSVYLINIPEPVQYVIYTLAFPFDLRCAYLKFVLLMCTYLLVPTVAVKRRRIGFELFENAGTNLVSVTSVQLCVCVCVFSMYSKVMVNRTVTLMQPPHQGTLILIEQSL